MTPSASVVSAQTLYETAKALHAQGRLVEAGQIYARLLEVAPGHLGVMQRLSEVYYRSGRTADAAMLARKAVDIAPGDAQMLSNLGVMLYQLGEPEEALPFLERSLALRPQSGPTHTNLGMVLALLKRHPEALASFNRAAGLDPNLAAPHNNIGNVLSTLRRYEDAATAFRMALERDPSLVEAWSNLGNALFRLRQYDEAVRCFERALAINPQFAAAHYNWGTVLGEIGAHEAAAKHYRRARELDPSYAAACNNLGRSLNAMGRPQEAINAFHQALALDPNFALSYAGLGDAYLFLGDMEKAREACAKAVALGPNEPATHRALSEVKKFQAGDPEIAQMEELVRREAGFDDESQAELHFSLFKAYADCGDYDRAFHHLTKGNAAKRRVVDYDEAANLGEMRATAATYTDKLLTAKTGGDLSEAPIFIFGMPRSGTTLVEQILASHPAVHGAGEASEFGRTVVGTYRAGQSNLAAVSLEPDDLRRLGGRYVAEMMVRVTSGKTRFTDKMPANFRFAGLIHMVLPRAHLIHVRRNPLDTCFSCYSKLFNGALDYTYELGELGRYYRGYEELMAHWRRVLPDGVMLEVRYEDLVADLEFGARALVAHCGLDWDAACLEFHKTKRAVITASTAQVRQPLYTSAIGRYKPYGAWLGPLREGLGEGAP